MRYFQIMDKENCSLFDLRVGDGSVEKIPVTRRNRIEKLQTTAFEYVFKTQKSVKFL